MKVVDEECNWVSISGEIPTKGSQMHHVLLILVFAVTFAGCAHEVQMVRIHPKCPEIPATTFKAAGLDATAGSVKFGQLVTLGEISIKSDPQIISGVSQGVRDDQQTRALICDSKERGELKTEEQVAYAWKVARFHRANPNSDEVIRFYRENPFPGTTSSQRKETDTEHAVLIRKLIEEGYALQADIEREYQLHHRQPDYSSNEENLVQGWNGMIHAWINKTVSTLQGIDPILVGRFNNAQISDNMLVGESVKWNSLNNYLNA
jgi:hypothetical protein